MNLSGKFSAKQKREPFADYSEYMDYIFACVNYRLSDYIGGLMKKYDAGQGNYKNVMYPDIKIAHDLCCDQTMRFMQKESVISDSGGEAVAESGENILEDGEENVEIDRELSELLGAFHMNADGEKNDALMDSGEEEASLSIEEMMDFIDERLAVTDTADVKFPFYELCRKLGFGHFSTFALAGAVLSSTQTSYAAVYQVVNENGSLIAPTVESTGRLYFGKDFSITRAYGEMSVCLEQLLPIMDLRVNSYMPFSTILTPDKRLIDFLFGKNPLRPDENYSRFLVC